MRAKPAEQGIPRSELVQHPVSAFGYGGAREGAGRKKLPYTPEIAEEICSWVADGKPLIDWCQPYAIDPVTRQRVPIEGLHRPSRVTVLRWREEYPDFALAWARAKKAAADAMHDNLISMAQDCQIGEENTFRFKAQTLQWSMARANRDVYGDKTTTDINQTIRNETPLDLSQLPQDVRDALRVSLERQIAREHDEKHTIDGDCTDLSST